MLGNMRINTDTSSVDFERLVRRIKDDEGFAQFVYEDGFRRKQMSIGYGTKAKDGESKISEEEADHRCREYLLICLFDIVNNGQVFRACENDQVRLEAFINMRYNLGARGFLNFRKMLAALPNWEITAKEMVDSLWHVQVPARSGRLAWEMITGKYWYNWRE
jgi:GH24 family phage-related lysozyme (muramidase)